MSEDRGRDLTGEGRVEISAKFIREVEALALTGGGWFFLVDVVEPWGGRRNMWRGSSYEAAILEAEVLRGEGWGEIVDVVGGDGGQAGGVVPDFGPP